MTLSEQIEKVKEEMCDKYCKYPDMTPPNGKDSDWLYEENSPCTRCPLNRL